MPARANPNPKRASVAGSGTLGGDAPVATSDADQLAEIFPSHSPLAPVHAPFAVHDPKNAEVSKPEAGTTPALVPFGQRFITSPSDAAKSLLRRFGFPTRDSNRRRLWPNAPISFYSGRAGFFLVAGLRRGDSNGCFRSGPSRHL